MKHIVNLFIIAIASVTMFTACNDDKDSDPSSLTIDHTTIDVMYIGGETLINVNTDLTWNATVESDWVKISPASGNGSEIVNVKIDKHLGLRRTSKINFTSGAITKTVDIQQRGIDSASYLRQRESRKVKHTYLDGNTAKVTWGDVTDNYCVVSELEYETVSGEWKTVIVENNVNYVECPNAKAGARYKTRSGFFIEGTTDILYKAWTLSKYPFLSLVPGTYDVDPLSYRYNGVSGEPTAALPQTEYAAKQTVTIETLEEDGMYKISDLFGGFYVPGRGEGYNENDHVCWGELLYDGTAFELLNAKVDSWGYGWTKVKGSVTSTTVTLDTYWNTSDYVFHLILHKK
jgi:hypothetical protein